MFRRYENGRKHTRFVIVSKAFLESSDKVSFGQKSQPASLWARVGRHVAKSWAIVNCLPRRIPNRSQVNLSCTGTGTGVRTPTLTLNLCSRAYINLPDSFNQTINYRALPWDVADRRTFTAGLLSFVSWIPNKWCYLRLLPLNICGI